MQLRAGARQRLLMFLRHFNVTKNVILFGGFNMIFFTIY